MILNTDNGCIYIIANSLAKHRRPSVSFYLGEPSSRETLFRKKKQPVISRRISAASPLNSSFLYANKVAPTASSIQGGKNER